MTRNEHAPRGGRVHATTASKPPPPDRTPQPPAPPPPPRWLRWLLPLGALLTLWLLVGQLTPPTVQHLDYSTFLEDVDAGTVATVTIDPAGQVQGTLDDGTAFSTTLLPQQVGNADLARKLVDAEVEISATPPSVGVGDILFSFAPLLLMVGLFWFLGRRASGQLANLSSVGRSRARLIDTERPTTRFDDVAGYAGVKREIAEVVGFLKAPERYRLAGATGPRGVLMVGPPGTGKTLLARAVAGEAAVPFLSVTGSSFVELFVGVGAARMRDLFAEARKRAPAIVFVDEIDAVGQRRGGAGQLVSNDEREQTLNQMLAEMDGFDPAEGVVVLAATNRPAVPDPALLRPGRFDRQVVVPLPAQGDRAAILAVHCRTRRLDPDVDLDVVARGTPGFSGADLANLVNEAAIAAVRDGRQLVTAADFDTARDRIVLGQRDTVSMLLPDEKRRVAVHEAGHALVAACSEHADPVSRVTILPAGMTLGATEQLPLDERHLFPEAYLRDALAVRLGGRAAELVVFGEGSSGAANDLATATDLATRMVREYGLSAQVGPVGYGSASPVYLDDGLPLPSHRYAEETQRVIDTEVAGLLRDAERRASELLTSHRDALDAAIALLLEHETIDGSDIDRLVRTLQVPTALVSRGDPRGRARG